MSNERINFYYDAERQGYDELLWNTVTGTPGSTGTALRFNASKAIGYGDLFKTDVTFGVIVPTAPTAGDVRKWGLEQITIGASIFFQIIDDVFSCNCTYNGVTSNTVVDWNTDWTATDTKFTIKWTGFTVEFLINGVHVASAGGYTGISGYSGVSGRSDESIPKVALSTSIDNENSDDLDVSYIETQNTQGYI